MAKINLLLLVIFCFCCSIQLSSAAAFAKDSFVVTVNVASSNYLYEYKLDGTKLQELQIPGRGPLMLDENRGLMTICVNFVNKNSIYVMNAKTELETTDLPTSAGCYAAVSGTELWYATSTKLFWTTRGSSIAATELTDTLTQPQTMQRIGSGLYLRDSTTLMLMDPAYNSPPAIFSDLKTGINEYYIYNGNIFIRTASSLQKYSIGPTGEIANVATWTYNAPSGLTMQYHTPVYSSVDEQLYIIVAMIDADSAWRIVRLTDSGVTPTAVTILNNMFNVYWISASPQPNCGDGIIDQDETDVDCGGSICPQCNEGKICLVNGDCKSGVCNGETFKCTAPTCNDNVKNQGETDIDCGGPNCGACADGKVCGGNTDCNSGVCTSNKCAIPTCNDNVQNGAETDVDCGGNSCGGCGIGKKCVGDGDCFGNNCLSFICSASCADGIRNQDESDVDCGGRCDQCEDNKTCNNYGDCANGFCNANNVCKTPTCQDNAKNQDESDVDCGGNTCSKCLVGKNCNLNSDCDSDICSGDVCVNSPTAPSTAPVDGPVNGPVNNSPDSAPSSAPTTDGAPGTSTTPIKQKPVSSAMVISVSVFGAIIAGVVLVL